MTTERCNYLPLVTAWWDRNANEAVATPASTMNQCLSILHCTIQHLINVKCDISNISATAAGWCWWWWWWWWSASRFTLRCRQLSYISLHLSLLTRDGLHCLGYWTWPHRCRHVWQQCVHNVSLFWCFKLWHFANTDTDWNRQYCLQQTQCQQPTTKIVDHRQFCNITDFTLANINL